jgi:hypothetical protein
MLSFACRLLETVAEASAAGEVLLEHEAADGNYLVTLRWPTPNKWREHARNLLALERMVEESRLAALASSVSPQ